MKTKALIFAVLGMTLVGCSQNDDVDGGKAESTQSKTITLTRGEQTVMNKTNGFAYSLYGSSYTEGSNHAISPVSATMLLSLMSNGAANSSSEQILNAIGYGADELDAVNTLNMKLMRELSSLDPAVDMEIANSVWHKNDISINNSFKNDAKKYYEADTYEINPATFVNDINGWCEDKTHGIIKDFLQKGTAPSEVAMFNAIYFKGMWNSDFKFSNGKSKLGEFTNCDGSKKSVMFMHNSRVYPYYAADSFQAISIPFGGKGFSFIAVLPNEGCGITESMSSMAANDIISKMAEAQTNYVNVALPRFTVVKDLSLTESLKALGITDVFDPAMADFSGLSADKLWVNNIKQKLQVSVDEEGATVAAVTGAGLWCTTSMPDVNLVFDRPFIYLITENSTNCILVMGALDKM